MVAKVAFVRQQDVAEKFRSLFRRRSTSAQDYDIGQRAVSPITFLLIALYNPEIFTRAYIYISPCAHGISRCSCGGARNWKSALSLYLSRARGVPRNSTSTPVSRRALIPPIIVFTYVMSPQERIFRARWYARSRSGRNRASRNFYRTIRVIGRENYAPARATRFRKVDRAC